MKHTLTIHSLDQIHLTCSCGWSIYSTYSVTKAEARGEHNKHQYNDFAYNWAQSRTTPVPSFYAWKTKYKNKTK